MQNPLPDSAGKDYPKQSQQDADAGALHARLYASTDALVWAEEFCKLNPEVDAGLMLGWFANVIQTAIDLTEKKLDAGLVLPRALRDHLQNQLGGEITVEDKQTSLSVHHDPDLFRTGKPAVLVERSVKVFVAADRVAVLSGPHILIQNGKDLG